MRRNKVRLTESQLHNVIKESVKRVLREDDRTDYNFRDYYRSHKGEEIEGDEYLDKDEKNLRIVTRKVCDLLDTIRNAGLYINCREIENACNSWLNRYEPLWGDVLQARKYYCNTHEKEPSHNDVEDRGDYSGYAGWGG